VVHINFKDRKEFLADTEILSGIRTLPKLLESDRVTDIFCGFMVLQASAEAPVFTGNPIGIPRFAATGREEMRRLANSLDHAKLLVSQSFRAFRRGFWQQLRNRSLEVRALLGVLTARQPVPLKS
jgi:hypothetical protein